jgi:hypothetical protein
MLEFPIKSGQLIVKIKALRRMFILLRAFIKSENAGPPLAK